MVDDYCTMLSAPDWGPFRNGEFFNLLDITDEYGKYYKPHYGYGIDPNIFNKYAIYGEKGFSVKVRAAVLPELEKYKKLGRVSEGSGHISGFKEELLKDNNILIISANSEYEKLPKLIKDRISRDEYLTIRVDKAVVLVTKK